MEEKDQLFFNMRRTALEWLQNCDPKKIARRANVIFDGDAFHLKSLGQDISVTYPHYQIQPRLQQWHVLTILHYLAKADGTALSGELISFSQHKDGLIRGGGFDANAESMIRDRLGLLSEQELLRRCHLLGRRSHPWQRRSLRQIFLSSELSGVSENMVCRRRISAIRTDVAGCLCRALPDH